MEHIVQFAIGIDDNGIKERIEKSAEKQIIEMLYHDIARSLTGNTKWAEYPISSEFAGALRRVAKEAVDNVVNHNKDEIIKEAATILADRIFRTKAAKELLGNIEVKENNHGSSGIYQNDTENVYGETLR